MSESRKNARKPIARPTSKLVWEREWLDETLPTVNINVRWYEF